MGFPPHHQERVRPHTAGTARERLTDQRTPSLLRVSDSQSCTGTRSHNVSLPNTKHTQHTQAHTGTHRHTQTHTDTHRTTHSTTHSTTHRTTHTQYNTLRHTQKTHLTTHRTTQTERTGNTHRTHNTHETETNTHDQKHAKIPNPTGTPCQNRCVKHLGALLWALRKSQRALGAVEKLRRFTRFRDREFCWRFSTAKSLRHCRRREKVSALQPLRKGFRV